MGKLTAMHVKNARPGVHIDGKGLLLRVRPSGSKSWVLRVQFNGRRRDIGLGSLDVLSLAEAREKAALLRKVAREGGDPKGERDKVKVVVPTFAEAVKQTHEAKAKGWSDKTAAQFLASLENHAVPPIGHHRVDLIESAHVIAALAPIWTDKPQIARKVRHRICEVLSYSKAMGWRSAPVPLPKEITDGLAKQPQSEGFAAMDYRDLPDFVAAELGKDNSPARLALLFVIFTAARQGEVRKADWGQIDRAALEWRRPASLMKNRAGHDVKLNAAALAILDRAAGMFGEDGLIFPSLRGKVLTDAAVGKMLRDTGRTETVHGFRSTFRTWAAEQMPHIPFDVAELALAHKTGSKTERAYLRADYSKMRRKLMDAWGTFAAPGLGARQ